MSFQNLLIASQKYFPKLKIKYKDESRLMKFLNKIFFWSPGFMKEYSTTVGETIYFPSRRFVAVHPVSCSVVLLHELVHLHDQRKLGKPLFLFSYLFPQILVPILLLMLFLVSWKIVLPLSLLFLAPIPAIFRTYWEKRAYLSSFYILQLLGTKLQFKPHLKAQKNIFLRSFHGSSYYYMWPFHNIDKQFDKAVEKTQLGERPFEDPVFDMLDDLATKV